MSLFELLVPSVCPACETPRGPGELLLCPTCALGLRPLRYLDGTATAVAYEGTGRVLLRRFKFDGRRDALAVLLAPLAERLAPLAVDCIVPVPRHRLRVRELGSDPVWMLARALSRQTGIPLLRNALERSRPTAPQAGLSSEERRQNVRSSFRARRALTRHRVLLLDDVTTTGATLREATRALRHGAGPRAVIPAALAATPRGGAMETEAAPAL